MFESEAVRCKSKRKIERKKERRKGGEDIYILNLPIYSSVDIFK